VDRRVFLMGATGLAGTGGPSRAAPATPNYSESVALTVIQPDAGREISLRLARILGGQYATMWAGFEGLEGNYALADRTPLEDQAVATAVDREAASFRASGAWSASFERADRSRASMHGSAEMTGKLHAGSEPPEGPGVHPASIALSFKALHAPVLVRPGRLEVFGRGRGWIKLPSGTVQVDGYAKWHEQVGDRPRFAPAFTYVTLQGESAALLAVASQGGHFGFALRDGRTTRLRRLDISPLSPERTFRAELEDGSFIRGTTRSLRSTSVPIEGGRRPGSTVIAQTDLGQLTGNINDWQPDA
jgi:hypothetical protein